MAKEQRQPEEVLTTDQWWELLKEKGEFWLTGKFRTDRVEQFLEANTIDPAAYKGHMGSTVDTDFHNYDMHLHAQEYAPMLARQLFSDTSELNDFLLECEKPNPLTGTTRFCFHFRNYKDGFALRNPDGVASLFSFILPSLEAQRFLSQLDADPQLLLHMIQERYGALLDIHHSDQLFKILTNVSVLFDASNPFGRVEHSQTAGMSGDEVIKYVEDNLVIRATDHEEGPRVRQEMIEYIQEAYGNKEEPESPKKKRRVFGFFGKGGRT